jgi:hypothetical protein
MEKNLVSIIEKKFMNDKIYFIYVKSPIRVYGFTADSGGLTVDLGKRQLALNWF